MAQQDIRYYLNGMLLVIDRKSRCRLVATDGHRLSLGEASPSTAEFTQAGGDPAPQDRARTDALAERLLQGRQERRQRRSSHRYSLRRQPGASFRFANVELVIEGRGRQVPRLQPRDSRGAHEVRRHARPGTTCCSRRSSAPRSSTNEKFRGVRPGASSPDHAEDHLPPATRSRKRPRKSSRSPTSGETARHSASTSPICSDVLQNIESSRDRPQRSI